MKSIFLIPAIIFSCLSFGLSYAYADTVRAYTMPENSGTDTIKNNLYDLSPREYFLKNRKSFTVLQSPESNYLVNVYISGNGFPDSKDTVFFDEIELIDTVIVADINNDGFEEIYLFTRGFFPGAYDHVFGVTSDEDKSYKEIFFNPLQPDDFSENGIFNGYQGQDVYTMENNLIKRTFPVYNKGDFYNNPSRGYRSLYYTLEKTESGYFFKLKEK
jgi:hypothetical protein